MNVDLMNAVEAEPSRKRKEVLLHEADDVTKEAIKFATDPFTTFGITLDTSNITTGVDEELAAGDALIFGARQVKTGRLSVNPAEWWARGFELMQQLASRELTGGNAHRALSGWLNASPDVRHTKWAVRVLNKDLRCGVSQETVAKLWPGLIEPFRVALAHPFESQSLGPGWIEPKLDGLRMVVIDGKAYTRNGHEMHNVDHIVAALGEANLLDGWVWDGECLNPGVSFEETSGALRKQKGGDGSGLIFHPFDVIDRESWRMRKTLPTDQRKADLVELVHRYREFSGDSCVKPIIGQRVDRVSVETLVKARDRYLAVGLEGAMYKDAYAPYQFKRSNSLLKFKRFETMDVTIIDVVEGSGKLEGMLGAFVVEIGDVRFNVGSGFTEHMRKELWALRETLTGKTIEVKYQNKTAKGKGRFPTFIRMRPDKDGVR